MSDYNQCKQFVWSQSHRCFKAWKARFAYDTLEDAGTAYGDNPEEAAVWFCENADDLGDQPDDVIITDTDGTETTFSMTSEYVRHFYASVKR